MRSPAVGVAALFASFFLNGCNGYYLESSGELDAAEEGYRKRRIPNIEHDEAKKIDERARALAPAASHMELSPAEALPGVHFAHLGLKRNVRPYLHCVDYDLLFTYYGDRWMHVKANEYVTLLVDGEPMRLEPGNVSSGPLLYRPTWLVQLESWVGPRPPSFFGCPKKEKAFNRGATVSEEIECDITPAMIERLAKAASIEITVKGKGADYVSSLTAEQLAEIRQFFEDSVKDDPDADFRLRDRQRVYVKKTTDEFRGVTSISTAHCMVNPVVDRAVPDVWRPHGYFEVVKMMIGENSTYCFHFKYHSGLGKEWMFIRSGESLLMLVDGESIILRTSGTPQRDTSDGGFVEEFAVYPILPEQLARVLQAKEVRVKIEGDKSSFVTSLSRQHLTEFKRFYDEYVKPKGLQAEKPVEEDARAEDDAAETHAPKVGRTPRPGDTVDRDRAE